MPSAACTIARANLPLPSENGWAMIIRAKLYIGKTVEAGGKISYFSQAAGKIVTSSVFEPFDNWFYGFAGRWAGISVEVLTASAAVFQQGGSGFSDDPQDRPHVNAGMRAFQSWKDNRRVIFTINQVRPRG